MVLCYIKTMDKNKLRKIAKGIRAGLDIENLSKTLVNKLVETQEYKSAKNIMIYYPLEEEINLLSLLEDKTKSFFLPKIDGKNLLCCPYKEGDKTCLSCFKTCEPLSEPCEKSIIDLVIVPALACDKNGYRLGYGGGFYDRFLTNYRGVKAACIPEELLFETVFPQKHDVKLDIIIC